MLGEMLGEETGMITTRRVLPGDGQGPAVEVSFSATGKAAGVESTNMGTYSAVMRPDGTLFGQGQGVLMGAGGEMASWVGQGVGRFNPDGSISYRGALYYQSNTPRWSRLNGTTGVYEHDAAADGSVKTKTWEWK